MFRHLTSEVDELGEAMDDQDTALSIEEAADCILLLVTLIDLLSPNMLAPILRTRFERNRTRQWAYDPDLGYHRSVK